MRGLMNPIISHLIKPGRKRSLAHTTISAAAQWRYLPATSARRSSTSNTTYSGTRIDIEAIRAEMLSRPPQMHPDIMSPTNSRLLLNTLSDFLPASAPQEHASSLLPPGHHLVYFPLARPTSQLCPDGTDPYHSPLDTPFTRRMWAGGSISGFAEESGLHLNSSKALCHERVLDVSVRGSAGSEKIFVEVQREYVTRDEFDALYDPGTKTLAPRADRLTERRTLVFMRELSGEEKERNLAMEQRVVRSPLQPTFSLKITPTPTLLFHYSALSYNAHRIHIDRSYCRAVEGHKDLLVHGPLSLTMMLSVLQSQLGVTGTGTGPGEGVEAIMGKGGDVGRKAEHVVIDRIDYRHLAPLYVGEEMRVCVAPSSHSQSQQDDYDEDGAKTRRTRSSRWDVWVENHKGGLSVKGVAVTKTI
ncbi:hypothetical protein F5Y17DRAFT_472219 [Xylariaceae sp. FL0594]|nr:hypothetical protein F5Y17DRAFT_472219 [Xylariaceae sp. FL0594]